jgi:starch synthase (maltosyl-transferring)
MVPIEAWRYIIARVRDQYPDTLFNLEGLGGKVSVTRDILNRGNMNWGYSELFQNYHRDQIEHYLPEAWEIAASDGIMVHFAETHDNNRLAATSKVYARLRSGLCALFSHNGAFGFANGVEWFAVEKINVHDAPSLNWGAHENQVAYLTRLHAILKYHPAFHDATDLAMIQTGEGDVLVLHRLNRPSGKELLIVVNLDDQRPATVMWPNPTPTVSPDTFTDLLTGEAVFVERNGNLRRLSLGPGQIHCLSPNPEDLLLCQEDPTQRFALPPVADHRRMRAKALEAWQWKNGMGDLGDFDPDQGAAALKDDPVSFCRSLDPENSVPSVVCWQWPQDLRREVMIPPCNFLMIQAPNSFKVGIIDGKRCLAVENSMMNGKTAHFALFCPLPIDSTSLRLSLHLTIFEETGAVRVEAPLLFLTPGAENEAACFAWRQGDLDPPPKLLLATNGIGGMLRVPVSWGTFTSRYDALLAANLNPDYPEDRWVMFSRCRGWVVYQGYSQELNFHCLDTFFLAAPEQGVWRFKVPTGQGEHVLLTIGIYMSDGANAMGMVFYREPADLKPGRLPDTEPIQLILRPDIEDRNFHNTTKANQGPETQWPSRTTAMENGFIFSPGQWRHLRVMVDRGCYHPEPEWRYMVHRPVEAERGLDPYSDLFSPGYFSLDFGGGVSAHLSATISAPPDFIPEPPADLLWAVENAPSAAQKNRPITEWLNGAMTSFVVKRGSLKSVVAGYPWFLDWGRDSLIFTRGLIAMGRIEESMDILKQFGRFEQNGTLPNMIHGSDAGNRDTSDAPLWFIVACRDLIAQAGNPSFLKENCGDRTMQEVLVSIGNWMIRGLENGVRMDPDSGLIYSPAHFTWMDTNFPAGSPRQGYPIEIQALWHSALTFLGRMDTADSEKWRRLASQVRASVMTLFYLPDHGYLSDCLHGAPGDSAEQAIADNALRPNQLFTLTLETLTDKKIARNVLMSCETLIVPGAIRSLADRRVTFAMPIRHHNVLLNDPHFPFIGKYVGDEDTHRKPAYHNGTAWTWPFPSFCEAWLKIYGENAREKVRSWLLSAINLMRAGCIGQLPEILDGEAPHLQRGCDAQAWGVSEWIRVWIMTRTSPSKGPLSSSRRRKYEH